MMPSVCRSVVAWCRHEPCSVERSALVLPEGSSTPSSFSLMQTQDDPKGFRHLAVETRELLLRVIGNAVAQVGRGGLEGVSQQGLPQCPG